MIEHKTLEAISLTCKSLLFSKQEIWVKKTINSSFHVTMGSFDGAKIYKIVGLYLLEKLSNLLGKENVGLYRADGLAAINSCSGPVLDRTALCNCRNKDNCPLDGCCLKQCFIYKAEAGYM